VVPVENCVEREKGGGEPAFRASNDAWRGEFLAFFGGGGGGCRILYLGVLFPLAESHSCGKGGGRRKGESRGSCITGQEKKRASRSALFEWKGFTPACGNGLTRSSSLSFNCSQLGEGEMRGLRGRKRDGVRSKSDGREGSDGEISSTGQVTFIDTFLHCVGREGEKGAGGIVKKKKEARRVGGEGKFSRKGDQRKRTTPTGRRKNKSKSPTQQSPPSPEGTERVARFLRKIRKKETRKRIEDNCRLEKASRI